MQKPKTSSRATSWIRIGLALAGFLCSGALVAQAQLAPEIAPPGDAGGGSFNVNPISLVIAKGRTSGSIDVTDSGGAEDHFSVSGYRWKQDENGKMSLEPADELVFFPEAFTLSGGKTARIRVGAEGNDPSLEQTYRIVISQLPPRADLDQGKRRTAGVVIGMKISVPVFIEPQNPKRAAEVDLASVRANELGIDVAATGNVHVAPSIVRVVATDDNGKSVLDVKSNVWYTLAGTKTRVHVPILQAQCSAITRVKLDLEDPFGQHLLATGDIDLPQKNCT
jgi:P pilus assembly chaperone PapD